MPVSSSLNFFSFVGQYSICFTLQGLDFLSEKSLLWLTLGIQNMLRFFAHTVALYQNYSCNGREWKRMKEWKNVKTLLVVRVVALRWLTTRSYSLSSWVLHEFFWRVIPYLFSQENFNTETLPTLCTTKILKWVLTSWNFQVTVWST